MTPLIFLDCETTGLCPDIHTPWEVAWTTAWHFPEHISGTIEHPGELMIVKRQQAFVKLSRQQINWANRTALEIGRFEERYDKDAALESAEIISRLQADTANVSEGVEGNPMPHLVGAVPSFDHSMLCQQWLGWPDYGEGLWHYHLVDVEVLAAGKLGVAPPYSSSDLTSAMGVTIDEETKHTAAGDVEWAMKLYAACYELEVINGPSTT